MTSQAHTPGPWKIGDRPFRRTSILAQGYVDTCAGVPVWSAIATVNLVEATDSEGRHWCAPGTAEANARLIAESPALLKCLKEAIELLDDCGVSHPAEWNAAVSRAEGAEWWSPQ